MEPEHSPVDGYLMGIREDRLEESREVKVKLPVGHLIRLHGIKIVEGRGISETIADALTVYFQHIEASAAAHEAPPGAIRTSG